MGGVAGRAPPPCGSGSSLGRGMSLKVTVPFRLLPQMKRAGTTGSARGMALYEEEVSWLRVGSGGVSAETTRDHFPPLFLPHPPLSLTHHH